METFGLIGNKAIVVDANQDLGNGFSIERGILEPHEISLVVHRCSTEDEVIAAAKDFDVLITAGHSPRISSHIVKSLPKCMLILRYAVGYDNIDVEAATSQGIIVANAPDFCTSEVSDHAVALIMGLARRTHRLDKYVREGKWKGSVQYAGPTRRLSRMTLGLLGLGRIGRQVASKMSSIMGTIIAYDPYVDGVSLQGLAVRLVGMDELLSESDFISLHMPLGTSTVSLIGAPQLARMKPTSFLVNTSRGGLVDEDALLDALRSGRLAGAALDVLTHEPLPADNPLRGLDNVVLNPHYGWYSLDAIRDLSESVAQSIADVLHGYWPSHVVNPSVVPRVPLKHRLSKNPPPP